MDPAGKHIVITGAASGIGRACAVRFAAAGATVVIADLDGDAARAAAAQIDRALAVQTDVGREREIVALIETARKHNGPIDLFFSNAGIGGPPGLPAGDADDGGDADGDSAMQLTWDVNVMAHLWAARALLPEMTARGDGYLLSTASAAGLLTQLSGLAYSITKHAAVALAEWLAITYADAGIKVSCVCPQAVNTPLLAVAIEGDPVGSAPMMADAVLEPEDVAAAVLEGVSDERFLILPHADVAKYMAFKGAQPERWLAAMGQLLRHARDGAAGG
jgi:NAD(P)-dependent dehydrogenase (short-subunit alcohol dehydrogenase family)